MKKLLILLIFSSFAIAQNITIGSGYQLGKNNESIGATISPEVYTFNNRKVIWRLYGSYYLGNNWGYADNLDSHSRFEFGFESKNSPILGRMFFNYFSIGYNIQQNQYMVGDQRTTSDRDGMIYSIGFGARMLQPFSIMTKYVWGVEKGIRLVMEYDLF